MAYTDIDDSSSAFQVKTWTGTGSSNALTLDGNSNLQPDWVMIKQTSGTQQWNGYDVIRGVQKYICWNTNAQEETQSQGLTAFGSDGFTVGSDDMVNGGSSTYVGYCWEAGGSASSNSSGNITSSVSANTTAGFSVVTYSGNGSAGATVGHGLGSAANLLMVKKKSSSGQWVYGSTGLDSSWDYFLFVDDTSAKGNGDNVFNDTAPTSSVFSIGNAGDTNASGQTYIAYCFAEKQGFSKFGSYTGNGSATDGTFVYTGFKPAFVMIKCSSESGSYTSWSMFDTTRQTFNVNAGKTLYANKSSAEGVRGNGSDSSTTIPAIDMLSNGFKCRVLNDEVNNTATYIYMAFAENPFTTSTGIPCTAR